MVRATRRASAMRRLKRSTMPLVCGGKAGSGDVRSGSRAEAIKGWCGGPAGRLALHVDGEAIGELGAIVGQDGMNLVREVGQEALEEGRCRLAIPPGMDLDIDVTGIDRLLQALRGGHPLGAPALAGAARAVLAAAPVVAARRPPVGRPLGHAEHPQAARPAGQQAPQQVGVPRVVAVRQQGVPGELVLSTSVQILINQWRHGDADPLLGGLG